MLKFKIGMDAPLEFTIKENGVAIDIDGGTIMMKIAKNILVADADAVFVDSYTVFTDPTNGIHQEVIAKETTATWPAGPYLYQVMFTDADGVKRSEEISNCLIEATLFE